MTSEQGIIHTIGYGMNLPVAFEALLAASEVLPAGIEYLPQASEALSAVSPNGL